MTEKRFNPSLDLTEIFFLNKKVQLPKFQSNHIKTTYDTNFKKFDIDFSRKANFNNDSERLVNSNKPFNISFKRNYDFKYNENEISDVYDLPKFKLEDMDTSYKYKYPKMSEKEFQKMQWQTEEGTPNILNQSLRSEQNNESIEDIRKSDDVYQEGLQQLRASMKEKKEKLKQSYNDIESNKNLSEPQKKLEKINLAIENDNNKEKFKQYIKKIQS